MQTQVLPGRRPRPGGGPAGWNQPLLPANHNIACTARRSCPGRPAVLAEREFGPQGLSFVKYHTQQSRSVLP